MWKRIDLTAKRFGRLLVIAFDEARKNPTAGVRYFWKCQCDCGQVVSIDGLVLRRGTTHSCGCEKRERSRTRGGLSSHPLYVVWLGMKQRCYNPRSKVYQHYGARGIRMCDRWLESVENFYADMGERPTPNHTVERLNNDGNYEPANCVWATRSEQNENTRQTRLLTFDGRTQSLGKWARELGVSRRLIRDRLDRLGWPVERALSLRKQA